MLSNLRPRNPLNKPSSPNLDKQRLSFRNNGYDVRVLGENPTQPGDLAIKSPGQTSEVAAQSKRLDAGTRNAVKNNLQDGTKQAGDGGYTVINGSGVGLTAETSKMASNSFFAIRCRAGLQVGNGKSGTVTVILGDGTVITHIFDSTVRTTTDRGLANRGERLGIHSSIFN